MKLIKLLILLLFAQCSFFLCPAQKEQEYLYQDSSIIYPDSVTNNVSDSENENNDQAAVISQPTIDTTLYDNQISISRDSLNELKAKKEFAYAKNLDSLLKEWKKDNETRVMAQPENDSVIDRFFSATATRYVLWGLAIFFIVFIIYRLFFAEGFFQRRIAVAKVIAVKEEDDVTNGTDYDQLISSAIAVQNYRLAVRYLYLQSLQKLAEAGVINFVHDKTNAQYVRELNGKPYKNEFTNLTRNYEFIWYGDFAVDAILYSKINQSFSQFNNQF